MSRRKGELTSGRINREWPYQVALPADQLLGKNYDVTYGSLGTAVGLMTWMWMTVIVILFGAELREHPHEGEVR